MLNQVSLIATVPLDIEGTHYEPGEVLQVSAARYGYLLVMGKARLSNAPAPPPRRRTRRGTYRRRDMQAEP